VRDGGIDPATNEPIDLAPTSGPSGIGGDVDPAAVGTGDTPRGDDTEAAASGDVTRDESTEEATEAIRSDEEGDDGPGILLPLLGGVLLLAAAAGVVRLVQKLRT
jgi:hypothetical protein